jgi:carnitine-CoA ligase
LRHWALATPDRDFLDFVDLDGQLQTFTYGTFYDHVQRLANALIDEGIQPGSRCVVHTGNSVAFMLTFWALQEVGAVAVPTVDAYTADELRYVVRHCGAWGIVAAEPLLPAVRRAAEGLACKVLVAGYEPSGLMTLDPIAGRGTASSERTVPAGPDDPAVILYTSGTTARPKGAMLSNAGAVYTATSYAHHLRLRPDDAVLTCMPLFHVNGLFLQMVPAVLSGSRLVLTPRFSASLYWRWILESGATVAHLVNGPIRLLLAGSDVEPRPGEQVRAMTFGLPLSDAEIAEFERRFGIPLAMVWGLTETCCGGTLMPLAFGRRAGHQSIGPALLGWEVRVADDQQAELPRGAIGELLVRSPGVMLGYYDDVEATTATLSDGWVRSGDLGYRDEFDHFHFVDRIKDMLKPSGENVAASEVETVISRHAAVSECAVIGIPDPVRGELVVALVVPTPGRTPTTEEIQELCAAQLAAFKVPSRIEFRDELPKTSIGKVRKGQLRAELASRSAVLDARGVA